MKAPPSKSIYHRELIVRFMCGDRSNLDIAEGDSDDVIATKACLDAIAGCKDNDSEVILPCKESGSTIRFMIPVASSCLLSKPNNRKLIFRTEGRLFDRPVKELEEAMKPHGITITRDEETRSIIVTGHMTPGRYEIDGSVSSQYISGLLMALPGFGEDSSIKVTGEMKSVHYIDLTLDSLAKYGAKISFEDNTYSIKGNGYTKAPEGDFEVEGDWSNGAFLLCLKLMCLNGNIEVTGLNMESSQGDKAILDFLDKAKDPACTMAVFDCKDTPDIVPYMAAVAPFFFDEVVFEGIARLRIKECDRVMAIRQQLEAIGVMSEETEDTIRIAVPEEEIDLNDTIYMSSYHDHRMAMTAVLLAARLGCTIDIDDIDCISKSYPAFIDIIRREMTP